LKDVVALLRSAFDNIGDDKWRTSDRTDGEHCGFGPGAKSFQRGAARRGGTGPVIDQDEVRIFIDQSDCPDQLRFSSFGHPLRGSLAGTSIAPGATIQSGEGGCYDNHAKQAGAKWHAQLIPQRSKMASRTPVVHHSQSWIFL
jgi:hypothetical protein